MSPPTVERNFLQPRIVSIQPAQPRPPPGRPRDVDIGEVLDLLHPHATQIIYDHGWVGEIIGPGKPNQSFLNLYLHESQRVRRIHMPSQLAVFLDDQLLPVADA